MKANDLCFCGSGRKFKRCHKASYEPVRPGAIAPLRPVPDHIELPSYVVEGRVDRWDEPAVKSPHVIERMRRTGAEAARILALAGAAVRPGVTTDEIDRIVHEAAIEAGAYPSPLLYGARTTRTRNRCARRSTRSSATASPTTASCATATS
jgi:methionyl aminopeptidase